MSRRMLIGALVFFTGVWLLLLWGRLALDPQVTFGDDARRYSDLATHLVEHRFYSVDGITPHRELEPGYGVFLAFTYLLFGIENRLGIFFLQGMLYIVSVLFFVKEVQEITSKRTTSIALMFFVALPSIYHTIFSVYRESFVLSLFLLFSGSVLQFLRTRSFHSVLFAGGALSTIVLTYIPFLLLPIVLLPVFLFLRLPPKKVSLMVLLPFFCIFVWGMRNAQYGNFRITGNQRSTGAHWLVRADHAERWHGWDPLRCIAAEYVTRSWTEDLDVLCRPIPSIHVPTGGIEDDRVRDAIAADAKRRILAHLPSYLYQSLFVTLEYHLPFVNGWGRTYNLVEAGMTGVLYGGCCVYLWTSWRSWKREHLLFFVILLYSAAIFSLFQSIPRFHMPVIFTYIVFAALGYDALFRRVQ